MAKRVGIEEATRAILRGQRRVPSRPPVPKTRKEPGIPQLRCQTHGPEDYDRKWGPKAEGR